MGKLTVLCPFCDRRYTLDDSHLGRKVRCKKCETIFFPEDALEPAAPEPDVYGFDDEPEPSWASSPTAYQGFDEEEELPPVARSSRQKPRSSSGRRSSRSAEDPIIPRGIRLTLLVTSGIMVLGLMFTFIGIGPGLLLCTLAMLPLLVLAIAGNLWFTVEIFRTGILNGILAIFVPFYSLFLLIRHWESLKRPFVTSLASGGLLALLAVTIAFMNERRGQAAGPGLDQVPGVAANMPPDFGPPADDGVFFAAGPPADPVGPIVEPPAPRRHSLDGGSPASGPAQPFGDGRIDPAPLAGAHGGPPSIGRGPSIHHHRENIMKVTSDVLRATSTLGALGTRPHDEQHWRKLEAACQELTADVESFQDAMPLTDLERQELVSQFGGRLGSIAGQLSRMTDHALQSAGQSPRADLIEVPRTLLAQVTQELGIDPGADPGFGPDPAVGSPSGLGPRSGSGSPFGPGPRFGSGPRFGPGLGPEAGPGTNPDAFPNPGFPNGRDAGAPSRPGPPSGFGPRGPRFGGPSA